MAKTTGTETIKFSFVYNATKETARKTMESISDSVREKMVARLVYVKSTLRTMGTPATDILPSSQASNGRASSHATPVPLGDSEMLAGNLFELARLPLEILLDLSSILHPLNLLALSRVSRALDNAIAEIDLPMGCPADMNEPQYASFIFEKCCSACGRGDAVKECADLQDDQTALKEYLTDREKMVIALMQVRKPFLFCALKPTKYPLMQHGRQLYKWQEAADREARVLAYKQEVVQKQEAKQKP
ncbi:hypothetical protein H0H87_008351 [Tephrocybe sp. NHM501043]|nr:hypothetical protein H0H87_008351 [Tephrocybe sp. NHM501043]